MISFLTLLLAAAFGYGLYRWAEQKAYDHAPYAGLPVTSGLSAGRKEILIRHFSFYQKLPHKSQQVFEHRVGAFIKMKEFVPRQMSEVTDEMRVLISACAVKLTFGLPRVFLRHFKYILVFPDQFFNYTEQRYHKGEVNPGMKAIVLSWKHFVEGYLQPEGVNLGIHEMAHALQLENLIQNQDYNFIRKADIQKWNVLASEEIERMRDGRGGFFRPYGSVNQHEFFAVAVENFFERPAAFNNYNPVLYQSLAVILNQDPAVLYQELQ